MSKTILVVDDEDDSRKVLKMFLEQDGFNVIEAADGYDAVEKAVEERPNLIIMDMAMPLVDGINSARTIRLHEELDNIPIIGLTAFGAFYDPRGFDAGCAEMVHKPVDFSKLKPIVQYYVN